MIVIYILISIFGVKNKNKKYNHNLFVDFRISSLVKSILNKKTRKVLSKTECKDNIVYKLNLFILAFIH